MDNIFILFVVGFVIGTAGTLIGAGGGFILVPLLLFTDKELSPEQITAISMAIVAANAISGSVAYARKKRIDYKAGILFALFTIPGSVLGVLTTQYIPRFYFKMFFGALLIVVALLLFFRSRIEKGRSAPKQARKSWKQHTVTDSDGHTYSYSYNQTTGILISVVVGYLSPLLGIGGGIIHVPALTQFLYFPVHVATATSHFILAVMSTVSVIVHFVKGTYDDPLMIRMVAGLGIGAIAGAQLGAWLSDKIHGTLIIRILAICLGLVGIRILLIAFM